MPLAEQPTKPLRGHKTICLPCSREQYEQCVEDPQEFRQFLDQQIEAHPPNCSHPRFSGATA